MPNSPAPRNTRRYARLLTGQRIAVLGLLLLIVGGLGFLIYKQETAPRAVPATEIARAINGPAEFQRPSRMEYVPQTNSCVVGGTVVSSEWHVGAKTVATGSVDPNTVDYTAFTFKSDEGRMFAVSDNGALYNDPGENLGLELDCDSATMMTAPSFGMVAIIWGGK